MLGYNLTKLKKILINTRTQKKSPMAKTAADANPETRKQLEKINLEAKVIDNTLANAKVTEAILATIQEAGVTECDKKMGNISFKVMLYLCL